METNNPNVLFNHQAIVLLGQKSQVMKQKLLLLLMLVSFISVSFAQNTRETESGAITVTDINSVLFSNSSSTARMANSRAVDVTRLRSLVTQVQSSTYYYEGVPRTFGEVPTNLFTDLSSLSQVDNAITLKDNIEIVTIRIDNASELNSNIDLAAFSNFPNLKYIYFITKLNTTSDNIGSRILNYDNRFNIYYKIDRGDSNQ